MVICWAQLPVHGGHSLEPVSLDITDFPRRETILNSENVTCIHLAWPVREDISKLGMTFESSKTAAH